jgi:hypothetical protein
MTQSFELALQSYRAMRMIRLTRPSRRGRVTTVDPARATSRVSFLSSPSARSSLPLTRVARHVMRAGPLDVLTIYRPILHLIPFRTAPSSVEPEACQNSANSILAFITSLPVVSHRLYRCSRTSKRFVSSQSFTRTLDLACALAPPA